MNHIHVCFATDENYAPYCGVAIASILKNADQEDFLHIYILDGGMSDRNREKLSSIASARQSIIEIIEMEREPFHNMPIIEDLHLTISAYFRFKAVSIIKEAERLIYLDCDLIVQSSLWNLYNTDMQNNYAAMVPAYEEEPDKSRLGVAKYFNSGVMLINCSKWREDKIESQLFDYVKKNPEKMKHSDQDAINPVLDRQILILDKKWNLQLLQADQKYFDIERENIKSACIIHFLSTIKPWDPMAYEEAWQLYNKYVLLTKNDIEKERRNRKAKIQPYIFENPDIKIYTKFLHSIMHLKNDKELSEYKIAVIVYGDYWKELRLAAIEKDVSIDYFVIVDDEIYGQIGEKVITIDEYVSLKEKEKSILLISESFDDHIFEVMQKYKLKDMRDYCFETDSTYIPTKQILSDALNIGGNEACRNVAVYGTAAMAKRFTRVLYNLGVSIAFYVSSFEADTKKLFLGKEVISPKTLKNRHDEVDKIIIASVSFDAIEKTLNSFNFEEIKDYIKIYV